MLRQAAPYLALFAFALAFRAQHLARPFRAPNPPGHTENERAALSLAKGGQLGNVFTADSGPSAHVSPLYPCLLAQIYRAAGWLGGDLRRWQELLVTPLTCAGIALLPLLARRARLTAGAGWLAALLLAVLPGNRHFEVSGCYEQPLIFTGLAALLLVFVQLREDGWRSRRNLLLAATLVGLCALMGPMLLGAAALMVLADLLRPTGERRAVLAGAAVLAAVSAVMLFPWAYRNHRVLGGWVWTRSNFGLELWVGNNPGANGQTYSEAFPELHPFSCPAEAREYKRLGELAYMRQKGEAARAWIAAHPAAFVRLTALRARWYWFPVQSMVWWDGRPWVVYLYGASTVGMLAGLIGLFWVGHPHRWLFVAAIVGFSLPYLVTHIDVRYRFPLCGLCALLTCDFVCRAAGWLWHVTPSGRPR